MQKIFKNCFIVLTLLAASFALGCPGDTGPKVYSVTGKVTLNGAPLEGASVIFLPEVESETVLSASGNTDAQGNYTLTTVTGEAGGGTTPGKFKVLVKKTKEEWDGKSYLPNPGGEPIKNSRAVNALPAQYSSPTKTPFTAEVTTDKTKNVFDFDVVGK